MEDTTISIHALLAESDLSGTNLSGARHIISIHALLAESDVFFWPWAVYMLISIHALLAESDEVRQIEPIDRAISIHALLAESDSKYHQIGPIVSV